MALSGYQRVMRLKGKFCRCFGIDCAGLRGINLWLDLNLLTIKDQGLKISDVNLIGVYNRLQNFLSQLGSLVLRFSFDSRNLVRGRRGLCLI